MEICVTASGEGLDAAVDPRFGRAPFFVFVDPETGAVASVPNEGLARDHGAGVGAAAAVAGRGARVLITGHCGPRALEVLEAGGVEVYVAPGGPVREAVEAWRRGTLERLEASDAPAGGPR